MNMDHLTPHDQALKELGNRLARVRKQHGYIQAQLAREAGIGVATLKRYQIIRIGSSRTCGIIPA